jgi:hypothetical protein
MELNFLQNRNTKPPKPIDFLHLRLLDRLLHLQLPSVFPLKMSNASVPDRKLPQRDQQIAVCWYLVSMNHFIRNFYLIFVAGAKVPDEDRTPYNNTTTSITFLRLWYFVQGRQERNDQKLASWM